VREVLQPVSESNRGNELAEIETLRIAETFTSRQGEGSLTGTPSFFVRTSGCNLRCWFCDTPYASWRPEGGQVAIDDLVAQARRAVDADGHEVRHVVLTGGEPLLFPAIETLCRILRADGFHVTVETAGTVDRDVAWDLLSLSPKFAGSGPDAADHPAWAARHEDRRLPIDVMRRLMHRSDAVQVKFVVDSPRDFDELTDIVERLNARPDVVWIMPQGRSAGVLNEARTWLQPWCDRQGYRYCDRMQIHWYGDRRGT